MPAEEEKLTNVACQVLIRARFIGSQANDTPALYYKDVTLVGYLSDTEGTYLSRENAMALAVASTKLYVQMDVPNETTGMLVCRQRRQRNVAGLCFGRYPRGRPRWTEYTDGYEFADSSGSRVGYKAEMTGMSLVVPRIHSLGATLS